VRVSGSARLTVVASGIEIGREYGGRDQTLTFAAGPARTFYLGASRRYVEVGETVGETVVRSYALNGREEHAQLALRHTVNALQSYSQRLGPYPYSELDVLSTPMRALGIEYPGAIGISLQLYEPDRVVSGLPSQVLLEGVVAHEVAHQWFYNVVGNDQVDEPWLDESAVQYVTALYYLDMYGSEGYNGYRASWSDRWERVDRAAIPIGRSSRDYAGGEYTPIIYGRGPFFLEALAERMGQDVFDAFLREYVAAHRWGIGTGDAFRQIAERQCACDLDPLFREWVDGE
jgi:aminopeptidase N